MTHNFGAVWAASDIWQRATLVTLMVATIVQTIFIIEFATRPWYRDRVGRALMIKSAVIAVILWVTIVNVFFSYPFQPAVSFLATFAVLLAIIYQTYVLYLSPRQESPWNEDDTDILDTEGQHP